MTDRNELDQTFVSMRNQRIAASKAWRAAGGYYDVGPNARPDPAAALYAEVKQLRNEYRSFSLANQPNADQLCVRIQAGDATAKDEAIAWLDKDPFCWNSGYLKKRLMSNLSAAGLNETQKVNARSAVLKVLQRGRRIEFVYTRRFARYLDSPGFRHDLVRLMETGDLDTVWRCQQILGLCERNDVR